MSRMVRVAEEVQWADERSLVVGQGLCGAVGQLPLLLAGSCRPGLGGPQQLERLRLGVAVAQGPVLELGPLGEGEVTELVGSLVGGRPGQALLAVTRQAGGNPLYARELTEALVR